MPGEITIYRKGAKDTGNCINFMVSLALLVRSHHVCFLSA